MEIEERENSEVITLNGFGRSRLDLPDFIEDFVKGGPHKPTGPTRLKRKGNQKDRIPIGKYGPEVELIDGLKELRQKNSTVDLGPYIPSVDISIEVEHQKKDEICDLLVNKFQDYKRRRKEHEEGPGFKARVNRVLRKLLDVTDTNSPKDAKTETQEEEMEDDDDTTDEPHDVSEPRRVVLSIQCQTLKSFISLCEDCISGKATEQFQPVEEEIKKMEGYENVSMRVVMYLGDFFESVKALVYDMKSIYADEGGLDRLGRRPYQDPLLRLSKPATYRRTKTGFQIGMTISSRTEEEYERFKASIQNGEKRDVMHELEVVMGEEFGIPDFKLELCVENENDDDDDKTRLDESRGIEASEKMDDDSEETNERDNRNKPETPTEEKNEKMSLEDGNEAQQAKEVDKDENETQEVKEVVDEDGWCIVEMP